MKRLMLALLFTFAIGLACPFSKTIGTGGQGSSPLFSDPQAGLAGLDNYRASLTISFKGSLNGQAVNPSDTYVQTVWPKQAAQFTSIDATDASGAHRVSLAGTVGQAYYFQADSSSPCTANWGAAASGPAQFQPATLLPGVNAAQLAGEESLDGIATRHYTFDGSSLGLPSGTTAIGEAWIAVSGGYVMKYALQITGAEAFFGAGAQGIRSVEYQLSQIGVQTEVVYPGGCEPVLTDMPAMSDATDLVRLPSLLAYSSAASADQINAFYQDQLSAAGWQKSSAQSPGTTIFTRAATGAVTSVSVSTETGSERVTVTSHAPKNAPGAATATAAPGTQPTPAAGNPTKRVALALNILLGLVPNQPAPPSYHLEAVDQTPVWSGNKIAQDKETMSADVAGKDVHYTKRDTPAGGTASSAEAYIISKQEYKVVNGKVQPATANSMTWTMWPLNPVMILSTGSTSATAAGTEVLDGHTSEVYTLSGTGLTAPGGIGMGIPVTAVSGKVWVDQQTGALLKAVLDYQADVRDNAGTDHGNGSGHLEITVSQIGQVTVSLPK